MRAIKKLVPLVLLLTIVLAVCTNAHPQLSQTDKIMGLSIVWKRAYDVFGYWELLEDLDWDAVYQEYIPKVIAAETTVDYYDVLTEFLALLRDGHSSVIFLEAKKHTGPVYLEYMDGRYVVTKVAVGYESLLGAEVISIGDTGPESFLEGEYGNKVGLHTPMARQNELAEKLYWTYDETKILFSFKLTNGETESCELNFGGGHAIAASMSVDWPSVATYTYETFVAYEHEDDIYRIVLNGFDDARLSSEVGQFLQEVNGKARAYILDARNNAGGNGLNALEVLRYFCSASELGNSQSRIQYKDTYQMAMAAIVRSKAMQPLIEKGVSAAFKENPEFAKYIEGGRLMLESRYYVDESNSNVPGLQDTVNDTNQNQYIDKPVVLLTGVHCASAGEDFVAMAKGIQRFTIIGGHTKGCNGQLAVFDLPGDGVVALSSRRVMVEQQDIINVGIQPDIFVEQSYDDYLQGADTVLGYAIEFLNEEVGVE